jgi:hypothetical protein
VKRIVVNRELQSLSDAPATVSRQKHKAGMHRRRGPGFAAERALARFPPT